MRSCTIIKNLLLGTVIGGGSGVATSTTTSAIGAAILGSGLEGYVASSAAASAAVGNTVLMGAGGAIIAATGLHDKLNLLEKPTRINDWVFWAKMAGFVLIDTAGTALGNAILKNDTSPMTAGATAAANLLGTAITTIPPAILAYAIYKAVNACKKNSNNLARLFGDAKPATGGRRSKTLPISLRAPKK